MEEGPLASVIIPPQLREELERREIEAPGCRPPNALYAKLLAVYLYEDDLCSAKFLWKRIPEEAKGECADLSRIWDVGKAMWNRNLSKVFKSIDEYDWSENVANIMKAVKAIVRGRSLELISRAYTSMSVSEFSRYVGMSEEEAISLAVKEPGWTFNDREKLISPVRGQPVEYKTVLAEKQLTTLTDFVSFLEK